MAFPKISNPFKPKSAPPPKPTPAPSEKGNLQPGQQGPNLPSQLGSPTFGNIGGTGISLETGTGNVNVPIGNNQNVVIKPKPSGGGGGSYNYVAEILPSASQQPPPSSVSNIPSSATVKSSGVIEKQGNLPFKSSVAQAIRDIKTYGAVDYAERVYSDIQYRYNSRKEANREKKVQEEMARIRGGARDIPYGGDINVYKGTIDPNRANRLLNSPYTEDQIIQEIKNTYSNPIKQEAFIRVLAEKEKKKIDDSLNEINKADQTYLETQIKSNTEYYQGKVNSGEMTLEEARAKLEQSNNNTFKEVSDANLRKQKDLIDSSDVKFKELIKSAVETSKTKAILPTAVKGAIVGAGATALTLVAPIIAIPLAVAGAGAVVTGAYQVQRGLTEGTLTKMDLALIGAGLGGTIVGGAVTKVISIKNTAGIKVNTQNYNLIKDLKNTKPTAEEIKAGAYNLKARGINIVDTNGKAISSIKFTNAERVLSAFERNLRIEQVKKVGDRFKTDTIGMTEKTRIISNLQNNPLIKNALKNNPQINSKFVEITKVIDLATGKKMYVVTYGQGNQAVTFALNSKGNLRGVVSSVNGRTIVAEVTPAGKIKNLPKQKIYVKDSPYPIIQSRAGLVKIKSTGVSKGITSSKTQGKLSFFETRRTYTQTGKAMRGQELKSLLEVIQQKNIVTAKVKPKVLSVSSEKGIAVKKDTSAINIKDGGLFDLGTKRTILSLSKGKGATAPKVQKVKVPKVEESIFNIKGKGSQPATTEKGFIDSLVETMNKQKSGNQQTISLMEQQSKTATQQSTKTASLSLFSNPKKSSIKPKISEPVLIPSSQETSLASLSLIRRPSKTIKSQAPQQDELSMLSNLGSGSLMSDNLFKTKTSVGSRSRVGVKSELGLNAMSELSLLNEPLMNRPIQPRPPNRIKEPNLNPTIYEPSLFGDTPKTGDKSYGRKKEQGGKERKAQYNPSLGLGLLESGETISVKKAKQTEESLLSGLELRPQVANSPYKNKKISLW